MIAAGRGAGPSMFVVVGPWLVLVLLLLPPVAFLAVLLLALALPFVVAGLAVAVVASPYLVGRAVHRRLAERRPSRERSPRLIHAEPVAVDPS